MRLIDADELQRKIIEMQNVYNDAYDHYDNGFQDAVSQIEDFVDGMATIEPKRGRWVETSHKDKKRCSVCDRICFIAIYPHFKNSASYCPNCGAKMNEE